MKTTIKAPAKLNLTFDITGITDAGYHLVESLMVPVSLFDTLDIELAESAQTETELTLDFEGIESEELFPLDSRNLINKAANLFFSKGNSSKNYQVKVHLTKRIPMGSGLGGGSSDAASTLIALNALTDTKLTEQELSSMAVSLGADVPFFIAPGAQVATGIGEILTSARMPNLHFVLAKPRHLSKSTALIYHEFDQHIAADPCSLEAFKPNLDTCLDKLAQGSIERLCLGNVFEVLMLTKYPLLLRLKLMLAKAGCKYTQMTGSGPTMFGVVHSLRQARTAQFELLEEWQKQPDAARHGPLDTWIVESLDQHPIAHPIAQSLD